jgi:integrase
VTTVKKPNLIRHGDRWAGHVRVGGRQFWQTFDSESEAARWVETMRRLRGGSRSTAWTNPKFADYAQRWLEQDAAMRVRPQTLARYRQLVEHHLTPQFGKRRLAQISADDVGRYVRDWLEEGPLFEERQRRATRAEAALATNKGRQPLVIRLGSSAQTITHGLNVGSAIFRSAIREHSALSNPFSETPRPTIPYNERPWLSVQDLERLFRVLDAAWLPLYALLAGTGLRWSEAAALRWRDIDLTRRRLVVNRRLARDGTEDAPKTGRSRRTVPIPTTVAHILREHYLRAPRKANDDLVFTNANGRPLSDSNLRQRVLKPALHAAGLPDVGHHAFRHSFVTNALAAGAPVGYVSRIVGHSSISVTMDRYGHLVMDVMDEAGDRIDDFIFGGVDLTPAHAHVLAPIEATVS